VSGAENLYTPIQLHGFGEGYEEHLKNIYDALGSGAYAAEIREPHFEEGAFDMFATAKAAGVRLILDPTLRPRGRYVAKNTPGLQGKREVPAPYMIVDSSQVIEEQELTVGHELGHHYLFELEKNLKRDFLFGKYLPSYDEIEDFCEYFGACLVGKHIELRAVDMTPLEIA
jgi:hypothetical protein